MDENISNDIKTASILIETAKGELDRKINSEIPEQTKRLAFYQGFCTVFVSLLFYLFINKYFQGWGLWLGIISASLCLAALLMSLIFSSGSSYPEGICKSYPQWLEIKNEGDIPVLSMQKDLLKQYQHSITALNAILERRGKALRVINLLLIFSILVGSLGL